MNFTQWKIKIDKIKKTGGAVLIHNSEINWKSPNAPLLVFTICEYCMLCNLNVYFTGKINTNLN